MKIVEYAVWFTFAVSAAFFTIDWIINEAQSNNVDAGYSRQLIVHILAILITAIVFEKFLPMRAISPEDWVYKVRPSQGLRIGGAGILIQILGFSCVGLVIGAANGHVVLYSVIAITLRMAPLAVRNGTVPKLLRAGRTKNVAQASGMILDSEVVHAAITTTQLRWVKFPLTSNYIVLTLARISRQPYLLLFGLDIVLLSWSIAQTLPKQSLILFLVSWGILGGAIARCADFSELRGSIYPQYALLFVHSLLGIVIVVVTINPAHPLIATVLLGPTIGWCGWTRSKKRSVEQINLIETGIFGSFSPEQISFYLSGLFPMLLAALFTSAYVI